ncbi:hypothetical protein [Mesonia mobilis]|uniref:hypothetical protein n=1 Tax=Mesonia mobilis TaxID=369791 RepID=UPI0026F01493|nr:hypothetical protein [Mesonia mobilis]
MKTYKILAAIREKNTHFKYDNYYLKLVGTDGIILNHYVDFTTKYIHSRISQLGIPVVKLSQENVYDILLDLNIRAKILPKYKGEDFIADEFTNPVTIDNGKTWIKPKIGETYQVYRDGYRVIYDELVDFFIDKTSEEGKNFRIKVKKILRGLR